MTPHFLPALVLGPVSASLPFPLHPLCLSSAVFIPFSLSCCSLSNPKHCLAEKRALSLCEQLFVWGDLCSSCSNGCFQKKKKKKRDLEQDSKKILDARLHLNHTTEIDGRDRADGVLAYGARLTQPSPHKSKHTPSLPRAMTFMVHYMTT